MCIYLSKYLQANRRTDLEHDNIECLWLWLRPSSLPRPFSGMAICAVYHPPGLPQDDHQLIKEYLSSTIGSLCNQHPNCGIILLGDFNDLDISPLLSHHNLKQVVKAPTRSSSILDLIITNLSKYYQTRQLLAPLGSSDHNTVLWAPLLVKSNHYPELKFTKFTTRQFPQSNVDAFGRWASKCRWFEEVMPNATVDDLASSFTTQLTQAIDVFFPSRSVKRHITDKPWITPEIKNLIRARQKAFHSNNTSLWRSLKHKVQIKIVAKKKSFYRNKVNHLKSNDTRKWWKIVNKMSRKPDKVRSFSLERDGVLLNNESHASVLNEFYVSVSSDIPPLDKDSLPAFLPSRNDIPTIQPHEVCTHKSAGPDKISNRILKDFAYILADPVATIFNKSLSTGVVPRIWKEANVIPIPKCNQPGSESDTRSISLTPGLPKVLEDFVVRWLLDDLNGKIDTRQFGCLKGLSTTFCLLDMLHTWLSHLDSQDKHIRAFAS